MARAFKPRKDVLHRIMSKVEYDTNGGCWLWSASHDGSGRYGRIKALGERQAHRAAYVLFEGRIPEGMELDHLCRVSQCVNPKHLEPVTRQENMRRAPKPGLSLGGPANGRRQSQKTHCPQGHDYSIFGKKRKNGWRNCRPCRAAKQRAYMARKKEA